MQIPTVTSLLGVTSLPASAPPPAPSSAPGSEHRVRNWHRLFLALGCAFVLLLLGSSHWQGAASLKALDELRQQAERVERLDSLLVQLMDSENAVRGYLLSGNRGHLEPYKRSLETIDDTLETIREDLDEVSVQLSSSRGGNDPGLTQAAFADLSRLVAVKLRSLELAIERGKAGEETRIKGKRLTDRIRDRILGLKAHLATQAQDSFERSTRHVERTRWLVAALTAGALVLMAVLFLAIERQLQLRGRLADLLQSENERLDAVVHERTVELSDLASYLTNAREAEKSRLARELHDELGALLTAAKMESGWLGRKLDGEVRSLCREHLARLDDLLDKGIALKRRIIDNLRPPLLEHLGLVCTLRTLADEFARAGEESIRLELPDADFDLAPEPALALYRIVQEALTNIRKHAQARQVSLALRAIRGWVELEIADDGVGFAVQDGATRPRHHGLAGMKHRVQMCVGEFTLTSRPGAGTRILVRIPLPDVVPAPGLAPIQGQSHERALPPLQGEGWGGDGGIGAEERNRSSPFSTPSPSCPPPWRGRNAIPSRSCD